MLNHCSGGSHRTSHQTCSSLSVYSFSACIQRIHGTHRQHHLCRSHSRLCCASSEIPRSCDGVETTKQAASCGQRRQRSLETPVSCLEALHYSWQTDRSTPRRGALLVVASHQRFPHPIHHTVPVSEAVRQRELPAVVQEEPVHLPLPLGRCLSPNLSLLTKQEQIKGGSEHGAAHEKMQV